MISCPWAEASVGGSILGSEIFRRCDLAGRSRFLDKAILIFYFVSYF